MGVGTVDVIAQCDWCKRQLPGTEALTSKCLANYAGWKAPFDPGPKTRVTFVGLAPPKPKNRPDPIVYIYKNPQDPIRDTASWLRDCLRIAIVESALEAVYPQLTKYFEEENQTIKRPFLDAMKGDGLVWDDCAYHPLPTHQVCDLLDERVYSEALADNLIRRPSERMIFMSMRHGFLEHRIGTKLKESGVTRSSHVFRMNFWPRTYGQEARRLSLSERGAEMRFALSKSTVR